jgi:acetoin:2,6-dichlorophenolindophenol oxidoreductase subunit alpha
LSETKFYENPLVPNKKLREMYVAMAEARVLDEHISGLQRRAKRGKGIKVLRVDSMRGQEACRVSTAIDLRAGDLVSDSQAGVTMELIAGAKVSSVLKRVGELHSGERSKKTKAALLSGRLLPWIEDTSERLSMAMGAALSFKAQGRPNVVIAYVGQGEIAKGTWRRSLELAAKLELPIIFVVLPGGERGKRDVTATLSAKSARWGVPGIPVDAGDAVALYRAAQESLGRTRGGDGPVLIECMEYRAQGNRAGGSTDPLTQMGRFLLGRRICTQAWLKGAADGLRRRIAATKQ